MYLFLVKIIKIQYYFHLYLNLLSCMHYTSFEYKGLQLQPIIL